VCFSAPRPPTGNTYVCMYVCMLHRVRWLHSCCSPSLVHHRSPIYATLSCLWKYLGIINLRSLSWNIMYRVCIMIWVLHAQILKITLYTLMEKLIFNRSWLWSFVIYKVWLRTILSISCESTVEKFVLNLPHFTCLFKFLC